MDQFQSFEINNQLEDNSRVLDKIKPEPQKINHRSRRAWSFKEDNKLKQAVKLYGTNWLQVAQVLLNRNPSQCAQRWKRIKPQNLQSKRQPWTKNEDQQLLKLVQIYKNNWVQIAENISNRTSKQVRERFINKLNPEINQQPFTEAEDQLIVEGFKSFGSQWCKISQMLKGRPENLIKNRFYSYLRKYYLQIENPYYVIPQKNLELPQKKNEHIKNDKKIKIPLGPIDKTEFNDELDHKDIKKYQYQTSQLVSKKSKIKFKTMLRKSFDIQIKQENFQDNNLLPSIKEEQYYPQSQVKEEPEQNNYKAPILNFKDENLQANFYTNSLPFNPFLPQIGLSFIPYYFLAIPIIQYGVGGSSKSMEMHYGNSNL